MKILFTIIVLIAGVYLILPKDEFKKLAQYLPQNQIEQAAETVLSDVDKKLEQFKTKLSMDKNSRISQLEQQLATLQTQIVAQQEKDKLADIQDNEPTIQQLPVEQPLAQNQYATDKPLSINPKKLAANNTDLSIKESDKQRAIKRQAYLQDLVERMNKTSLLTLTN
jgi:hypothetical protein